MKINLLVPMEIELADERYCNGCEQSYRETDGYYCDQFENCKLLQNKEYKFIRPTVCKAAGRLAELHEKQKAILAEPAPMPPMPPPKEDILTKAMGYIDERFDSAFYSPDVKEEGLKYQKEQLARLKKYYMNLQKDFGH